MVSSWRGLVCGSECCSGPKTVISASPMSQQVSEPRAVFRPQLDTNLDRHFRLTSTTVRIRCDSSMETMEEQQQNGSCAGQMLQPRRGPALTA